MPPPPAAPPEPAVLDVAPPLPLETALDAFDAPHDAEALLLEEPLVTLLVSLPPEPELVAFAPQPETTTAAPSAARMKAEDLFTMRSLQGSITSAGESPARRSLPPRPTTSYSSWFEE